MASLKSVMTRLNKAKREEDKIKFIKDHPKDYFVRGAISTGSVFLDLALNGGFTKGSYNTIVAGGGTGKSSIALLAIKAEFEATGRIGVYYDAEGTLDESYLERMGVGRHMVLIVKGRNLEDMLNGAEAFSTADEVGVIVMDSIPIFVATSVEAKGAEEHNMAVEARKYSQRMPIIEGNCSNRNITIIGITSFRFDPSAMGDPRKLSRGAWQYTMSNVILSLTKKDIIKGADGHPIGHVIDARVLKSKTAPYNPKEVLKTNFYYEGGFNRYDDYTTLFVEANIIVRGGAWYSFANGDGEEVKFQGKEAVIEYLKENEEMFNTLLKRYNGN
jgi:RecA/RadA recombinase